MASSWLTTLRCSTVRFHTRSGSGSRSTPARTTTWCESPSTVVTSVSASRRGRTTTAPLRSRHRRRTSIRRRTSTACSSAPACPGFLAPAGGGYLFDNVTVTTQNGPGPPGCDLVIDKEADAPTVRAGGLAGYTISVRNRGRLSARNVRVCDRVPRGMTFVGANRKLSRLGERRCLLIPRLGPGQRVSLHVDFRVDGSAPTGTVANIADVTPGVEPPGSPGRGSGGRAGPARGGSARGGQEGHGRREGPAKAVPADRYRIAASPAWRARRGSAARSR